MGKRLRGVGHRALLAIGIAAGMMGFAVSAASSQTVFFFPGEYSLAQFYHGPPVDTLVVSISGGVANFDLSGADNETFSILNNSTPTGFYFDAPYFLTSSIVSASWSSSAYPYLTFWPLDASGGLTAGPLPGTVGPDLFNTFQSEYGPPPVVFRLGAPEPSTWAMMLVGFALLGFAAHRRGAKLLSDAKAG